MTKAIHRRHDISDEVWNKLKQYLSGRKGSWGGCSRRQSPFYQCGVLDYAHRCPMA